MNRRCFLPKKVWILGLVCEKQDHSSPPAPPSFPLLLLLFLHFSMSLMAHVA